MIAALSGGAAAAANQSSNPTTATPDPLANKQVFLQLLVAQLKHQDPTHPQDGAQFVTQLAQFSQLEQSTSIAQGVASIETLLAKLTNANNGGK